ncbi:SDR family NAD(P)-dependent oxidoreductase [Maritimibacter alkaliphilus]|uniref:SDR family NAD(P)-dependent oxidoreductase n=1 Tax=Maritimibacter alkaliphilus TaxID=404236 RepID=UPI001C960C43|nr:SDR family NAD(P)-dependent oxidoreductase [Maritimibacter alkaliphilus]MBY6090248.1 SDR family NAD(P)-dependent oxidoreductase [Maritimibacter alkaliphilus]
MQIVLTGASRGIGAALREIYEARGDSVTGTSRAGGDGLLALDATDPTQIKAMADALQGTPIDLLICNAGVYLDKGQPLDTGFPADMWAQEFATNVTGPFQCIQALLPNLRAAGGKVAVISSAMGSQERAPGGSYIYRASKAAVLNVVRNLAADLAPEGIALGAYHPGWVRTDMGGSGADIDVATSAKGLVQRFDALSPATSGCFETYEGTKIPF